MSQNFSNHLQRNFGPFFTNLHQCFMAFDIYCHVPVGGVTNKPPGLQAGTRHGARDHLFRSQVELTYGGASNLQRMGSNKAFVQSGLPTLDT